ncbi:putative mitochondrial carrier protein [Microthyrium microscopicum]|uniref:Putative mitochondrial carrier protein n=1 Tax=Microthyrium microscopicum TaxID=703497 RepID=A0A6A6UUM6_9PEZI|nr:putative mitochondrial carrier protein [Microthyrium microscopicum]
MSADGSQIGESSTPQERHHAGPEKKKTQKNKASTGASAAGVRALSAQVVGFYFRAPMKAFFRSRVDYMAYARAIHPHYKSGQSWSWRVSTPGLLANAIRTEGWMFLPKQLFPPMIANISIGAVLYTSYLHMLGNLHEPSAYASRRIMPPPEPKHTMSAGFIAGSIQSVFAAPMDALQVRFKMSEMLEGRYRNMWDYAFSKLREIGVRGIFAGWSLTFVKDATSCAVFFSTFEYVKAQAYYAFLPFIYSIGNRQDAYDPTPITPHYMIEPAFLLMAGAAATVTQQSIQFPLTQVQTVHYNRLESLDYAARAENNPRNVLRLYYNAYMETFRQAKLEAQKVGGMRRWLYQDFLWSTLRQTPSTSAGLIVFEIVRRKYGIDEGGGLTDLGGKQFIL